MKNFQNDIDKLVSSILNEEIDAKVRKIMETKGSFEDGRDNIDVAEPKGKITAADFKKLRDAKSHKKEVEEFFMDDDSEEEEAEELSQNEPTYVGRGLKDNKIMSKLKDALRNRFNDEDEEELDFETDWSRLEEDEDMDDYSDDLSSYDTNGDFMGLSKPMGDMEIYEDEDYYDEDDSDWTEIELDDETDWTKLEEDEANEGNAFSGARAKAIEDGKDTFEVDGKMYHVKGEHSEGECTECGDNRMYESEDKWIQKTDMKKGALHKKLGIPEGDKIPKSKLNSIKKDLMAKAKGDKKLSAADSKLLKQVNMALTLGGLKESRNTLSLTENELIDMIERIVKEEMVKDPAEKDNFKVNKPQGLKKTEKAQGESKKENDDYTQEVVKKMKDYMKDMFSGGKGYEENPDDFPQSNYDMEKEHNEMKYHPSDAVEEYIEAFAYPGMTNLVYDEIKPEDKNIEKQIKGDSKNGNAITGKDGKALGNVSKRSEKVGDRFKKNFDENLYGAEQQKASYKRQSQPVDVAGNGKTSGSLKSKQGSDKSKQGSDKSSSINKASKILNTLESTEDKATKIIKEDLQKMMGLISYDRKTQ